MFEKIKAFLFATPEPAPAAMQDDLSGVAFESIYEAQALAQKIDYSFVATIGTQRWRVYPDRSPRLIHRGRR